jgi:Skp family chaperone for outer membrane proteins
MFWALVSGGIITAQVIWDLFLKEKAKEKIPAHLLDLIDIAFMTSGVAFPSVSAVETFRAVPTAVKLAKGSQKVWEALKRTGLGVATGGVAGIEGKRLYEKGKEFKEHIGKREELEREREELERERQELLEELQELEKENTYRIKELERQLRHYEEIQRHLKEYLEKKNVIFLPVPSKTETELKYNLEKKEKKKGGKER